MYVIPMHSGGIDQPMPLPTSETTTIIYICVLYTACVTDVVHVPRDAKWWDILQFLPNQTEAKVLGALARINRGNAYQIWKDSGLKHYPTVLRTLKKLEKKRLVTTLATIGGRGGKAFCSTQQGTFVLHISSGDEKRLVDIATKESSLLQELFKMQKADNLVFEAIRRFILESCKGERSSSLDDAVQYTMEWSVIDGLNDGIWNRQPEELVWLTKMSRVGWIRDLIFEHIKDERERIAKGTESLDAFETRLRNRKVARARI